MPTTTDLIGLALDKNPVEFATAFDDLLRQKQEAALEARKEEIAKGLYGDAVEDEDDFDLSDDVDFEADETDEGDDDLDIDLDDLELDLDELDLDLEDITNDDQDA